MASTNERLDRLEALVLGLKKEIGMLRRQIIDGTAPDIPKGECRLGLEGECTRFGTYQYQKGCRATLCSEANSTYYSNRSAGVTTTRVAVQKPAPEPSAPKWMKSR